MRFKRLKYLVLGYFLLISGFIEAQEINLSNYRKISFKTSTDTVFLDSLSVIPSSFIVKNLDPSDYEINYLKSYFILKNNSL